jgi:micrococcal nuclease
MKTIVRSRLLARTVVVAACFHACLSVHAHQVISIADGDTLTLAVDGRRLKIRLANIDAPERGQAYGRESRRSLSELCFRKDARYRVEDIDQYGRTVAAVECDGVDASRAQVERGMAWVARHYNRDASLPMLQAQMRWRRVGLWADANPIPPWEFRHTGEAGAHVARLQEPGDGICYTGPRGGRYRLINGKKRYGC